MIANVDMTINTCCIVHLLVILLVLIINFNMIKYRSRIFIFTMFGSYTLQFKERIYIADDSSLSIAATSTGICLDHYAIENSFKNNSLKKSDVVRRNIGTALAQSRRLSQDR